MPKPFVLSQGIAGYVGKFVRSKDSRDVVLAKVAAIVILLLEAGMSPNTWDGSVDRSGEPKPDPTNALYMCCYVPDSKRIASVLLKHGALVHRYIRRAVVRNCNYELYVMIHPRDESSFVRAAI